MADRIIDRLVSSLAAGLLATDEFIDAVENQVEAIASTAKEEPGQVGRRCIQGVSSTTP